MGQRNGFRSSQVSAVFDFLRATFLTSLVLCVAGSLNAQRAPLQLVQADFLQVPPDLRISGGALGQDGRIGIWSREDGAIWLVADRSLRRLCAATQMTPVGMAHVASGVIEVVDARGNQILTVDSDGSCHVRLRLPHAGTFSTATRNPTNGKWGVIASGADGHAVLMLVDRDNSTRFHPLDPIEFREASAIHIRAGGGGFVLSRIDWPFDWTLISIAGQTGEKGRPFATDFVMTLQDDTASVSRWLALPTHWIGDGFLQIIADPRSDARALVRYDQRGNTLSTRLIDVSLGLLDFDFASERLLALRRTNGLELVTYRLQQNNP